MSILSIILHLPFHFRRYKLKVNPVQSQLRPARVAAKLRWETEAYRSALQFLFQNAIYRVISYSYENQGILKKLELVLLYATKNIPIPLGKELYG